jgi:two-component system, chemotaxis family, sensor kinase CheA
MAKQTDSSPKGGPAPVALESDISNLAGSLKAAEPREPAPAECPESETSSASSQPLNQDPELLREFLVEAREHLTNIESKLLEFDQGNPNAETLNSAFRSFHTLKGLAGFLEFGVLQEVAHEVESVLDRARNGELQITPPIVDVILEASDYIAVWLNHISAVAENRPSEVPASPEPLIRKVRAAGSAAGSVADPAADSPASSAASSPAGSAASSLGPEGQSAASAPPRETSPTVAQTEEEAPKPSQSNSTASPDATRREESSVVKIATSKLEYLVDMVGELVIAESMVHHNPDLSAVKTPRVQRDLAHLGRITAEVQKTGMAMRMVPVGQLFRRMARLVRDLARKSGKKADLELIGEDVELDRRLVEELSDPLIHMIRNSMDHGLEGPEERVAAGKPETGIIRLAAKHQAGEIHIEVADDGRGLNRDRILAKAVERGLVGSGEQLSDHEIYHLIFKPGFSTAEKVTEVSGRGVGMDVVWRHLVHLRGRVEIRSTPGHGSRFLLRLPLTLAIIDGLVVLCGDERYIVPISSIREMFRPTAESIFTVQGKGEMVLVRGQLLPLVRLKQRLNLKAGVDDPCQGLIVVGESETRQFCLLVDTLSGKQEVVIKSLGPQFANIQGLAGGAILGDGRVGLILDLSALLGGETKCQQVLA